MNHEFMFEPVYDRRTTPIQFEGKGGDYIEWCLRTPQEALGAAQRNRPCCGIACAIFETTEGRRLARFGELMAYLRRGGRLSAKEEQEAQPCAGYVGALRLGDDCNPVGLWLCGKPN